MTSADAAERFRSWQAVLLGWGGDDGYWMRLLGNTGCVYRRVGALMISADAISYGEIVARRRQPVTLASKLFAVASKVDWLLTE